MIDDVKKVIDAINNYNGQGDLYMTKANWHSGRFYIQERYYAAVEVDWTRIGGPFTLEEATFILHATGIPIWGTEETKRIFYGENV